MNSAGPGFFLLALIFLGWVQAGFVSFSPELLQKIQKNFGQLAHDRLVDLESLTRNSKALYTPEKLILVNDFYNDSIRFIDDIDHWKKKDYWATPMETLVSGGGDCEDFTIAKYYTLLELGVPEEQLHLTYVKTLELNQAHMVLTYFSDKNAIPLVLDNLIASIQPADKRKDLVPVYSFNGTGLWLAKERGKGRLVGGSQRVGLWEDLEKRLSKGEINTPPDFGKTLSAINIKGAP